MKYAFADYVLDPASREVRFRGAPVPCEPQVFDLVLHLLTHRERVVSVDEMVEAVWAGRIVSESTIRNRVNAARRLLGDDGERQAIIRTLPRRGLRFVAEVVEEGDGADPDGPAPMAGAGAHPSSARRPVVAILPFVDLSSEMSRPHLADALTEDIITLLARHRSLAVVARNSSFGFKGAPGDMREAGRALGADYVVEGSARLAEGRLRVTVHLIRTATGQLIWGDLFDRPEERLFELQDEIASVIVASLEPLIGRVERARARRKTPANLHAWDLFHIGTGHMYRATRQDNLEAQRLLRLSIEDDGAPPQAYAHLAYAILLSMLYFEADPDGERLAEAHHLARWAVERDADDAMNRFVFGRVLLARQDYAASLGELEEAVSLNPALAIGHCGLGDALSYSGRYAEAFPCFQKAVDLSPHDPQRWAFLAYRALAHVLAGEYEDAALWASRATRIPNCHYWPYVHRVAARGHLGRDHELEEAVLALNDKRPGLSCRLVRQRLFYIRDIGQLERYTAGLEKAGLPKR
jgi:TolB-like protein